MRITARSKYRMMWSPAKRATSSIASIWYDLGFGTGRAETESNELRHKSGSAILRKASVIWAAGGFVPAAFTKGPFLLTMDTETAKLDGLKTAPGTTPAARPGTKG